MKPIKIVPKNEEEWLKLKEETIGASEIITVCGLNPYKSPYEYWLEKTGRKDRGEVNDSMIRGKIYEAPLVDFWELKTGHKCLRGSKRDILYIHPEKRYLSCTPDRFFWHASTKEKWLCEAKNPDNRRVDEAEKSWIMQIQYQMGITGIHKGIILWDYPQRGVYFMELEVEFNKELFDMMVEIADHFWNENILKDIEPEMTVGSDVLFKYPKEESGVSKEGSDEMFSTYIEMSGIQSKISELSTKLDEYKSEIQLFMQEAESVKYCDKTLFTWKANKNGARVFRTMK
jgi:putative phage-type endonuclease